MCCICYDDYDLPAGLECGPAKDGMQPHFMCNTCFSDHVLNAQGVFRLDDGRICCPLAAECEAPPYTDQAVASHVPEIAFTAYVQFKTAIAEQRIYREAEGEFRERLEAERARLEEERVRMGTEAAEAVVWQHRTHVVNKLLVLLCPCCTKAFYDFEACFALKCETKDHRGVASGCRTHFCAYCLKDCGTDRDGSNACHQHVAVCPFNIAPGRDVFGTVQMFERAQQERRQRLVQEYVASIADEAVRQATIDACAQDLADLGIHL
jgi:hypothetical protein